MGGIYKSQQWQKGPSNILTLNGRAREAALEIPVEEMTAETGINKLLEVLDELCLKGEVSLAYELMSLLKNLLDQLLWQSMIYYSFWKTSQ